MRHANKGFLLIDSLINVFIVSNIALLCMTCYKAMVNYEDSYLNYQKMSNEYYETILSNYVECEACVVDEPVEESDGIDD